MDYPLTLKALAAIDAFSLCVDKMLDDAETNDDVLFYEHVRLMQGDYVRQAFLQDTVDRNNWDNVRGTSVESIRAMVGAPPASDSAHLCAG